jgi:hypothetical protein
MLSNLAGLSGAVVVRISRSTGSAELPLKRGESVMIRIAAILVIAAAAASGVVSSASAQAFTGGYGTGNMQTSHFDGRGSLVADFASQNGAVAASPRGQSAYAAAPRANRAPIATRSGSAGYNELLMNH